MEDGRWRMAGEKRDGGSRMEDGGWQGRKGMEDLSKIED
jgi:hypothetical protein